MIKHTNLRDKGQNLDDEFPFKGPQFVVGERVRVRPEYRAALKGVIDVQSTYVISDVNEETVDHMIFDGQPDGAHYRYQSVKLEGVKYHLSSDRFELVE